MGCRRLCESLLLKDVIVPGTRHYGEPGVKKCRTCNKFFCVAPDQWKCPCCTFRLSVRPKQPRWKKKYEMPSYTGPQLIKRY